ncbi:MAG: hypothetical protein FJX36_09600 [Alphaproteobacteria bacterium]|nr:hypothetical protein [Alphaproteobacteria bacterium]
MILRPSGARVGLLAHRPTPIRPSGELDAWLVSYADMVSLLLAFFVAIVAIVGMDEPSLEAMVTSFVAETGGGDNRAAGGREARDLSREVRASIAQLPFGKDASVIDGDGTVAIELPGTLVFARGAADLNPEAVDTLRAVADVLRGPDWRQWTVAIEGHSDDTPMMTTRFPTPWELSAARATAVVRLLEAFGVASARLSAVGYGAARPSTVPGTGRDPAANDRVVIVATR